MVRSHISKIMEKAILQKIKTTCPHLIDTKVYQTGFKEGKSTAIHASRLLHEVHGRNKRKFYMLIDLQKAYDSVDREILWKLLKDRCQDDDQRQIVDLIIKLHRQSKSKLGDTNSMQKWDCHKAQFYHQYFSIYIWRRH